MKNQKKNAILRILISNKMRDRPLDFVKEAFSTWRLNAGIPLAVVVKQEGQTHRIS